MDGANIDPSIRPLCIFMQQLTSVVDDDVGKVLIIHEMQAKLAEVLISRPPRVGNRLQK